MREIALEDRVRLTEEQQKSRRRRSIAIAVVLAALVMIFYVITLVRLGPGVTEMPL